GREPIGEVKDDAGEKPRFSDPEQKAQDEEAGGSIDESKPARDQSPGDHHARYPAPCADPLQDQIARHLQQKVTPEERAGAETEYIRAQSKILVHGQGRKPDVYAVQITDEIQDKTKWQ